MADFYDHPETGKFMLRAPALGGEYHGLATETDIRNHPDAYQSYLHAKHTADMREAAAATEEPAKVETPVSETPPFWVNPTEASKPDYVEETKIISADEELDDMNVMEPTNPAEE